MKIVIKQSTLVECLNKIQSGVQTKSGSLPILQNFLMEAKKDSIKFISTDLDIAIKNTYKGDFKIITEGSVTIPFRKLYDILGSIDEKEDVILSVDDDRIILTSGKTEVKIATLPVSDYPAIPSINEKQSFKVNAYDILYMIEKTIFSVSNDDKNTVLNGLLWKKEKNSFTVVSTDGRRLSIVCRDLKDGVYKDFKVVIPSRILDEISHFIKSNCDEKDDVVIDISSNQIGFRIKDTDFVSRFIDGNFPAYESVIPKSFESSAIVSSEKLLISTKRAVICAGDVKTGFVKYNFKKDVLIISSSSQTTDLKDEIDCSFNGKENEFVIVFNPKFIIDILKNTNGNIEFKFTGATTPAMIKTEKDPKLTYILMPLKSY